MKNHPARRAAPLGEDQWIGMSIFLDSSLVTGDELVELTSAARPTEL